MCGKANNQDDKNWGKGGVGGGGGGGTACPCIVIFNSDFTVYYICVPLKYCPCEYTHTEIWLSLDLS